MQNNEETIREFLKKMATQDNRSTAHPFYYVIRTKVQDPAPVENCNETRWYWQDSSYDSWEEIEEICRKDEMSEEEIKKAKREAVEYGVRDRWEKRGMFLTETDAENHLRLNHYHYSHDAHTYVEHAWRAPELTAFFKALFDHFQINS